jgi:hypothetical protein
VIFEPGTLGREASRKLYRELITKRITERKLRKEIFSKGVLLDQGIHLSSVNPRSFLHLFNRVYDRGYTDRALLLALVGVRYETQPLYSIPVTRLMW